MKLQAPITIQRPPIPLPSGGAAVFDPEVTDEVPVTLVDSDRLKTCIAVMPHNARVVLWSGSEYDAAAGFTRAQAEARLMERMGPDFAAALHALMYNIPRYPPGVPF